MNNKCRKLKTEELNKITGGICDEDGIEKCPICGNRLTPLTYIFDDDRQIEYYGCENCYWSDLDDFLDE